MVAMMRAEIKHVLPEIAVFLQPKCGENRMGYCDESLEDWQACPIGKKRPHKKLLFELYDAHRRGELAPLAEGDFEIIEQVGSSVATAGSAKGSVGAPPVIAPNGDHPAEGTPSTRDEG
jgi:hypothetical protein